MLGLDYQGQTALASFPKLDYAIKASEEVNLTDRTKINFFYRFSHLEEVIINEKVTARLVILLRVFEQLHIRERIKLSYAFILRELALLSDRVHDLSIIVVNELVHLKDEVQDVIRIIVSELVTLFDNLKVNGKDVIHLWQACYKKVTAEVENVYKKFRR